MYATRYIKPENLDAAISALQEADEGKILAGGMTLIPTLKQRLAAPDCLIDISALGLSSIRQQGDRLIIGAMCRHADVEHSDLGRLWNYLYWYRLASGIGDRQVRNRGTIGGSLANNDPAACYPAAILALAASIQTSKRLIEADDFFTGMFETALAEDEIITEIHFLKAPKAAYVEWQSGLALCDGGRMCSPAWRWQCQGGDYRGRTGWCFPPCRAGRCAAK